MRKKVRKLEDTDQHEEKNAITVFNPELQPSTDNCYRAYYLRKKKANISFEVLEGKVHGVNVRLKLQMIQLQEMQKGPT